VHIHAFSCHRLSQPLVFFLYYYLCVRYTVLQPVTAALLTLFLLGIGLYPNCKGNAPPCLDPPGWGALVGMTGVFGGLSLIILTEPSKNVNGDRDVRYEQVDRDEGAEQEMI